MTLGPMMGTFVGKLVGATVVVGCRVGAADVVGADVVVGLRVGLDVVVGDLEVGSFVGRNVGL